jgi:serpin B
LRVTALAVLLVAAACDSSIVPSASPSSPAASPSAVSSPAPTEPVSSPEATAQVEPSPGVDAGDFVPGALAVTVSDRLRVRSQPRVADDSIRYQPVLPVGTELEVIGGPVEASGYTWVHVAPVGVTLDDGATDGWVAIADHDGTPWVEASAAPLAGLAVAQSSVERAPVIVADAKRTAAGVNAFGVDLYRRLLKDPDADLDGKGVSMSPMSIAAALAMARAGAEGATASQMDDMLRTNGWNDLGSGVGSLQQILNGYNATWTDYERATHSLSLNVVNRAFGQDGWSIQEPFLDRIARVFGAGLGLVDFANDTDAARDTINAWVARQTADRIKKLLSPSDVSANTRLVLVNAIYLKANWLNEFDEDLTAKRTFTLPDGDAVQVPTMRMAGGQNIALAEGAGWQATELTYVGADRSTPLAMTLILPDDLASFEDSLAAGRLNTIQAEIASEQKRIAKITNPDDGDMNCPRFAYDVELFLPKFGVDTRAGLVPILKAMGMRNATDPERADFSGITGARDLFIAMVIHQANIDVDEKGTEAAAATAVGMDTTGGCGPPAAFKHKELRLDRPFMYLIRDTKTGAILFMGRVLDPTKR